MANTSQAKQHALVEAFRKAGIDVTVRESNSPFSEIVLTDENGRKYKVSKDLKVKPALSHSMDSFSPEIRVALKEHDIVGTVYGKQLAVARKVRRGKVKLTKANKRITKFGKLKG